ncbi:ATP-dependent DNA helicase DinG [Striga asiatica]|uniref:ATP-dependent DNA helicase DinG n=1 Tax=Striga asiatica TaxID=4170 RepID=A0A5A7PIU4_STRAF|nr:ATP-dependent DNA helicase DinG [Striga asiatica]
MICDQLVTENTLALFNLNEVKIADRNCLGGVISATQGSRESQTIVGDDTLSVVHHELQDYDKLMINEDSHPDIMLPKRRGWKRSLNKQGKLKREDKYKHFSRIEVKDGVSSRIWEDPWVPSLKAGIPSLKHGVPCGLVGVYQLLEAGDRRWNFNLLHTLFDD